MRPKNCPDLCGTCTRECDERRSDYDPPMSVASLYELGVALAIEGGLKRFRLYDKSKKIIDIDLITPQVRG